MNKCLTFSCNVFYLFPVFSLTRVPDACLALCMGDQGRERIAVGGGSSQGARINPPHSTLKVIHFSSIETSTDPQFSS